MNAAIIEAIFKITLVPAVAAAVNIVWLRRRSAASRHLVWTLATIGVLALPALSAVLPKWELPIRVAAVGPVADTLGNVWGEAPMERPRPTQSAVAETSSDHTIRNTGGGFRGPDAAVIPWALILGLGYAAGVMLLLARLAAERLVVARLTRSAVIVHAPEWSALLNDCMRVIDVRGAVRLLRSAEQTMPRAVRIRRPAILIPAVADMWTEDRRRAVLLHELAHIARRDCLTQSIASLACAAYWIHPGVWWMARRLRIERELACDDR